MDKVDVYVWYSPRTLRNVFVFILYASFLGQSCLVLGQDKLCGVAMMGPEQEVDESWTRPLLDLNSNWVALVPMAHSYHNKPDLFYCIPNQWWGELPEGIEQTAIQAKKSGLKVMIKPQVNVPNGWSGGFHLMNEDAWIQWEMEYQEFILSMAEIAQKVDADLFCFSTEYKNAIVQRPQFWTQLISKVKCIYSGPVTYAANWDNYSLIPFWSEMDYIGIDAYFPLSSQKTPKQKTLLRSWQTPFEELRQFSKRQNKKIIFTEYGYRSTDFCAWQQWETEHLDDALRVNLEAQTVAFQALYQTFWKEEWFYGGFVWKWFSDHCETGGKLHSGYTPQNKPSSEVIKSWYGKKEFN